MDHEAEANEQLGVARLAVKRAFDLMHSEPDEATVAAQVATAAALTAVAEAILELASRSGPVRGFDG